MHFCVIHKFDTWNNEHLYSTHFLLWLVVKTCILIQVSCGGTHSVALTRDGRMFSVKYLTRLLLLLCLLNAMDGV